MADNLKDRGAQDRARINLNESWEVQYWSKKFGISADELRTAVEAAGPMSADVQRWLEGKRSAA